MRGDAEQLRVAFRNLIDNAIRYAGGEVHVEVRVRAVSTRRLEVEVADRGVGIPASALDRVFQRFRACRRRRCARCAGSGLGLYIVRNVARAHGGKRARRERRRRQGQPLHPDAPRTCRLNARILLVEDEEHLARGLAFNLEAEGYRVEVTERGEAALERLVDAARAAGRSGACST